MFTDSFVIFWMQYFIQDMYGILHFVCAILGFICKVLKEKSQSLENLFKQLKTNLYKLSECVTMQMGFL